MKFQRNPIVVEAVKFFKAQGIEDGYAIYETEYPEEGHAFELANISL
ncbi:hypothetical protein ACFCP7_10590 [Paenibacillus elgii]